MVKIIYFYISKWYCIVYVIKDFCIMYEFLPYHNMIYGVSFYKVFSPLFSFTSLISTLSHIIIYAYTHITITYLILLFFYQIPLPLLGLVAYCCALIFEIPLLPRLPSIPNDGTYPPCCTC